MRSIYLATGAAIALSVSATYASAGTLFSALRTSNPLATLNNVITQLIPPSSGGGSGSGSGGTAPTGDGKVFALLNPGNNSSTASQFAALNTVDGLAFRDRWSKMETSAGTYDWSRLDAIAKVAAQYNKALTIHIGADLPSWLAEQGASTYTYIHPYQGTVTTAVPWDTVFLERHKSFVTALAAHIKQKDMASLITVVSVAAPVAEMSLPDCSNGKLGNGTSYDRGSYLSAWQSSINAYSSAFSDPAFAEIALSVSAPVAHICAPDNDGKSFYADLVSGMKPSESRLAVFMADLNALGSARLGQVDNARLPGIRLLFQTIWSQKDDPTNRFKGSLQDAVCASWAAGARYIELYQADLLSSDVSTQNAVSSASNGSGCNTP